MAVRAVPIFQPVPAPARRRAQQSFGQCTQVVGHLFNRQAAFHVTRQNAKHFGMVRPPQQVQQGLVIVFTGALQSSAASFEFLLEVRSIEALFEHRIAC